MNQTVAKYIQDVKTGVIPSGLHLRNAITRFETDLLRSDLEFREDSVNRVIDFIGRLEHYTGSHNGKPFILEPWQQFIVSNLYGFYTKSTNLRRFQTAYIEIGRKNGKTALVAALSLYHLVADSEPAAEILFAANSKEQAKRGFDCVRAFTSKIDPKEKILKRYRADINFPAANSFIKVLASDSDKLDGYNCSLGIIDEYHSAPDSQVRDVIRSSQGMRDNPMLITITTAGFDKTLPCYELRTTATEIAAGHLKDDTFFGIVFSLDDGDDWKDPKNWIKANPNLGITIKEKFIADQVQQAINSPSDEVGVKTKNLNLWCDSSEVWIPESYVLQGTAQVSENTFNQSETYVGVDLAAVQDLTAVSYLTVKDGLYYFKTFFYVPSDGLKNRPDSTMYRNWKNAGYLITTTGNVTDYEYITRDMLRLDKTADIRKVYYDSHNATQWAIQCTDEGLNLEPFGQSLGNFNSCTKEFERLLLSGKIVLDDNPIIRYCIRNVELATDHCGNVKPKKGSIKKKIDGVISCLQALAAYQSDCSSGGTNIF